MTCLFFILRKIGKKVRLAPQNIFKEPRKLSRNTAEMILQKRIILWYFGQIDVQMVRYPIWSKLLVVINIARYMFQDATCWFFNFRWSATGTTTKDPRQLTNRSFQRQMIEEIMEFLNESGYPHVINVKILSAPTTKEFLRVFEVNRSALHCNFCMYFSFFMLVDL